MGYCKNQEELMLETSSRIVSILKSQGVTKKELADRMDTTISNICQFTSGQNLKLSTLANIAKAINYEVEVIFKPKEEICE